MQLTLVAKHCLSRVRQLRLQLRLGGLQRGQGRLKVVGFDGADLVVGANHLAELLLLARRLGAHIGVLRLQALNGIAL